jgi:hypothetical protein
MTWLKILIAGFLICHAIPSSAAENLKRGIGWPRQPVADWPDDWVEQLFGSPIINIESRRTRASNSSDDFVKLLDIETGRAQVSNPSDDFVKLFESDQANCHFPLLPVWLR